MVKSYQRIMTRVVLIGCYDVWAVWRVAGGSLGGADFWNKVKPEK